MIESWRVKAGLVKKEWDSMENALGSGDEKRIEAFGVEALPALARVAHIDQEWAWSFANRCVAGSSGLGARWIGAMAGLCAMLQGSGPKPSFQPRKEYHSEGGGEGWVCYSWAVCWAPEVDSYHALRGADLLAAMRECWDDIRQFADSQGFEDPSSSEEERTMSQVMESAEKERWLECYVLDKDDEGSIREALLGQIEAFELEFGVDVKESVVHKSIRI